MTHAVSPRSDASLGIARDILGLCDSKGSLGQIKKRHKTDVGVEHFHNAAGPLKKVEPEIAS